jgi:hypothetical protein
MEIGWFPARAIFSRRFVVPFGAGLAAVSRRTPRVLLFFKGDL